MKVRDRIGMKHRMPSLHKWFGKLSHWLGKPRAMKRIAFLGASVTGQTHDRETGEVTGYVEAFRNDFAGALGFEEVIVHAYSGNRISDAGLICAYDILKQKPDVVILEITIEDRSRGSDFTEKHLNHLCNDFISNGVLPIFLALPEPGERHPFSNPAHDIISRFTEAKGLPLCVIELPPSVQLCELYRDGVHTNRKGADLYASELAEYLRRSIKSGWPRIKANPDPSRFQIQSIQKTGSPEFRTITIQNRSSQQAGGFLSIIQRKSIGKHSPVIEIEIVTRSGASLKSRLSIWDPYCHYSRESFVKLAETDRLDFEKIVISVSSELPDYATCRRGFDYKTTQESRHMHSNHPFWVISNSAMNLTIDTDSSMELSGKRKLGKRTPKDAE
jgi:lysophospholipase L1-like esterase